MLTAPIAIRVERCPILMYYLTFQRPQDLEASISPAKTNLPKSSKCLNQTNVLNYIRWNILRENNKNQYNPT
jgi:hypothetical protein